ncbi:B-cell receptor CD22 [Macrotis lagotis]|uniref:B-cell receptor CD22 n=1 Tax=Macrotis lagotis TaxID=92651 RepID=UPI003D68BAE9
MSLLHLSFLAVGFLARGLCKNPQWVVSRPAELYAWEGMCVQIPCSYKIININQPLEHIILYQNPQFDNHSREFSGSVLFDLKNDRMNRKIDFLGKDRRDNCSMLIHKVMVNDSGILGLRMKVWDTKWMTEVKLNVTESAPQPYIQLPQQLQESQQVTVTCFLKYYCSLNPVSFLWTLDGQKALPQQVKNSYSLKAEKISTESKFTFTPNWTHHGKELTCQLQHANETLSEKTVQLDVKHTPKLTIKASTLQEVKEGESVTLRCLLQSSNPKIQGGTFIWYKDGENKQNEDENLVLNNVNWQQTGNYTCETVNEMGPGKSEPLHLQVLYSPRLSKVFPVDITVRENDMVELICRTLAYPPPTIFTWYQDEEVINGETNQKLRFQEVTRQRTGQYTCQAENSEGLGKVSERATLDVQYPPTEVTITISSQIPIREGDSVTLSCSYNQSNPPVRRYKWRIPFSRKHETFTKNLTIHDIPWNAETVTCWACSFECSQAAPLSLDVQYAPRDVKVILVTPKSDIRSGDRVQLRCDFSFSQPRNVHYFWTQNGKRFHEGRYLNWSSITPEDSGLYSCIVTNSIGEAHSLEWNLKIQYAPRHLQVSIVPGDTVMETTSVVLICEADANPAINLYTWFDWKGQKIDNSGRKLILWPVMTHQSGAYWCQGTNKLGTGESSPVVLTVYYSPETIGKRTGLGLGVCLAILCLALLGFQFIRCWKKIRGEQFFQEQPSRQGSFFIRKKKIRRPHSTAPPQPLGYYNPAVEERSDYATLQLPPGALYLETSPVSLQTKDQSVTYAVVQKPHRGDYENVMPQPPPEEDGLHYSELILFGERGRPTVQERVEYVTLKH